MAWKRLFNRYLVMCLHMQPHKKYQSACLHRLFPNDFTPYTLHTHIAILSFFPSLFCEASFCLPDIAISVQCACLLFCCCWADGWSFSLLTAVYLDGHEFNGRATTTTTATTRTYQNHSLARSHESLLSQIKHS